MQDPRERFICHPRSIRGVEGHILAPALLAPQPARDAPSQDVPLLGPGALRQLMLLFLLLIPLLGTGPWVALVCIRAWSLSQLGMRSWAGGCLRSSFCSEGEFKAQPLGLVAMGKGKGSRGRTAPWRKAGAHWETGAGLCSAVHEPVLRLGESDHDQHPLPQGAKSHHAEGALAACPLPLTSPQKAV